MPDSVAHQHPKPVLCRTATTVSLHFTWHETQSCMDIRQPEALSLEYTRTMMGFLLFIPEPQSLAMVGLGGGSLAKFCHRHLTKTRIKVVEINPHIVALRDEFHIPADSGRFRVVLGDGAEFVRNPPRRFDVLLLDGYDQDGLPLALSSQRFYDDGSNSIVFASRTHLVQRPRGKPVRRPHNLDGDAWVQLRSSFARVMAAVEDETS